MKSHQFMQRHQLETFARFLEEHPGFSPILVGEDALVCSFEIGGTHVSIAEMERMIAAGPLFDPQQAAFLLARPDATASQQ